MSEAVGAGDRDAVALVGDRAAAREVQRARRGAVHAAGWGQVLQDWYVGIFITATLLTMLFAATGPAILRPDCDTAVCPAPSGYGLVATAMTVLGAGALLVLTRAAGPVWADPGRATWLLATPADRGLLLRGGVARVGVVAVVAGAAWGVITGFAVARALGGGSAAGVVALAGGAGALVGLAVLLLALALQGGSVRATRAARAVPDAQLARAGEVVGAVSASTTMLDSTALELLGTRRRLARRGRHPSRAASGGPVAGVLVHELRAVRRRWRQVLGTLVACLAVVAVALLLGRLVGVALAAVAALGVARTSGGGLRTWLSTPGLRRAVPAHPAAVTLVMAVAPFVLALVGAVLAVGPLGLPWWAPIVLALAATAGAMRASDPPPGLGVALATPAGPVHTGLVQRLVLGTDLALVGAVAVLVADAQDAGLLAVAAAAALVAWQVGRTRD